MKIKSFLIGCVGGLVALTGAQAADLPVKAQPVQYMKICSLYGVGFYYIPGTDMCLRVGGYVRSQAEWGSAQGLAFGSSYNGVRPSNIQNGLFTRLSDNFQMTGRGMITVDARNQSEYGTIRGYLRLGAELSNSDASQFVAERAFIQFAGTTFGLTQSFFDIFTNTELFTYTNAKTSGDTYNYGVMVAAYTAQFGGGFSGTIAAELGHYRQVYGVVDGGGGGFNTNGGVTTDTAGFRMPDIVGNLRLDQNWGYVGVSGAIHQVAGAYYGPSGPANFNIPSHPDDKYGWAAQVGGLFYLPWLGARDSIGASFVYTKGAPGYATKAGSWQIGRGDSVGAGWVADGVFDSTGIFGNNPGTRPSEIHLTNAWSVNAGLEHFWNPRWRTSLYGGYTRIWYDQDVTNIANQHLPGAAGTRPCGIPVEGAVWPPPLLVAGGNTSTCSPNFSFYQVGSRTQWNITNNFYMGVDVTYTHLNTAYKGANNNGSPVYPEFTSAGKTAATVIDDQSIVSAIFRAQLNFEAGNEGPSYVFAR